MGEGNKEVFRDSISTIDEQGKRSWIYPKKPKGKFYTYRTWLSVFLLIILLSAPFIKLNGNQLFLFNVLERKFNIFGFPFWPQDFYLLVISMLVGVVFIILFTVIYGRVFCGWICPQTIFLEMVFRKIDYWIEGDKGAQKRLAKQEWNADKIKKRVFKHSLYLLISFIISNVFLAYIISSDVLLKIIVEPVSEHIGGFISIWIFTGVFYFIFSWFREQVCIIACPYGRLQGVLLDNKSIIVAYDYIRGESKKGRAKFRKNENRADEGKGACIDCDQCVEVCPTGIDIRNGTQLECVNCTACMDACDFMMKKTNQPEGLIRYASEENIEKNEPFEFTLRIKAYTAILVVLVVVLVSLLTIRTSVQANFFRVPGELFQIKENRNISNVYTYKLVNKTSNDVDSLSFKLLSHTSGIIKLVGTDHLLLKTQSIFEGTIFIEIPQADLEDSNETIKIGVYKNGEEITTTKTHFLSPKHSW
ncbi:cytochrome c oxidase accessory protein FixG [Wenyingzhuangia heitensis]|uniref:Cytochrome c oxidase accessory protein FixG n=1 Tax=Wenyingzhuangia heitensis TaxID=1487859 RepID=A0ABX0U8K8_9FLAO|nr:cytochrome c oxidase accessory protein CcoG [Wenyingzhuangia heitensis]NIJ45180.1 cytochrome c oxidase accessory protein FixG [Wenyingzhuangia heitensis]